MRIAPILAKLLIPIMRSYIGGGADFGTVTTPGLKVNLLELEKAGNCTSILPTLVVVNTPLEVRHFCGAYRSLKGMYVLSPHGQIVGLHQTHYQVRHAALEAYGSYYDCLLIRLVPL